MESEPDRIERARALLDHLFRKRRPARLRPSPPVAREDALDEVEGDDPDSVWKWLLRPSAAQQSAAAVLPEDCVAWLQAAPAQTAGEAPALEAPPPFDTGRLLASTLDAIVRAARMQLPNYELVLGRALQLLRGHAGTRMNIEPASVHVDGQPVLETDERRGLWLASAYLAGLESLASEPDLSLRSLAQLANELAELRPAAASIAHFRDWLWSGGAEGFQITMRQGLGEKYALLQCAGSPLAAEPELSASTRWLESQSMQTRGRHSSSLQRLDEFAEQAQAGGFGVSRAELETLREAADAADAWHAAEAWTALQTPGWLEAAPAPSVSRGMACLLAGPDAVSWLPICRKIFEAAQEKHAELAQLLESQDIGTSIARGLVGASPQVARELAQFLRVAPAAVQRNLLLGLLEKPSALLIALLKQVGRDLLIEPLQLDALPPRAALNLVRLLWQEGEEGRPTETTPKARAAALCPIVARLSDAGAVAVLVGASADLVVHCGAVAQRILRTGSDRIRSRLVDLLARPGMNGALRWGAWQLFESLDACGAEGWSSRARFAAVQACQQHGLGKNIVALVLDRGRPPALRAAGLDVLSAQPALLKLATKPQASDLLEPRSVRQSLERARNLLRSRAAHDNTD